jgi:hypothetical protein
MNSDDLCEVCGLGHPDSLEGCPVLQEAAAAGAHPHGVPTRVYGGYLEARAALRANAAEPAIRTLQWLLGHIAEERGVAPGQSFSTKLQKLCNEKVISPKVEASLFPKALADEVSRERAWALMSIAEHALYRLYLKPRDGRNTTTKR